MLADKLNLVKKNIEEACDTAGRSPQEVTLIAVSKTKPVEKRNRQERRNKKSRKEREQEKRKKKQERDRRKQKNIFWWQQYFRFLLRKNKAY